LHSMRSAYRQGKMAQGKAAALRAVGAEFDGKVARAIREQHKGMASGKGKEAQEMDGSGEGWEMDASDDEGAEEEEEGSEGEEMEAEGEMERSENFEGKLEELKEYKRRHGHACPRWDSSLGRWLCQTRYLFNKGSLAADKAAALRAVGVEFDGKVDRDIREQHEGMASGTGKGAEQMGYGATGFEKRLEELKEYKRRHGACLRELSAMVRWLWRAMRLQVSCLVT